MKASEKKEASRVVRIAERLAKETLRTAYVPDEPEEPGEKALAGVTTVEIRVVFPVAGKRVAITRRKRREMANHPKNVPYYPLETVKRLLGEIPPKIRFTQLRTDGKANPQNISPGFTDAMAIEIIRGLTPSEFHRSYPRLGNIGHIMDAYLTRQKYGIVQHPIYIKFYVDGNSLVCVESFHLSDFK